MGSCSLCPALLYHTGSTNHPTGRVTIVPVRVGVLVVIGVSGAACIISTVQVCDTFASIMWILPLMTLLTNLSPALTAPQYLRNPRSVEVFSRQRRSLSTNPHRPLNYTWTIKDFENQVLYQISNYTIWPWFPTLHFDFAEMSTGVNKFASKTLQSNIWDKQGSCSPSPQEATRLNLYFCPEPKTAELKYQCGTIADKYCASWSCISTGAISWTPPRPNDYISIARRNGRPSSSCTDGTKWHCCGQRMNPLNVTFTTLGKALAAQQWAVGYTWGGREWSGSGDDGNVFSIRLSM